MGMNINLDELNKISSTSETIKSDLSTNFKEMTSLLESICKNVNSSELTKSNTSLVQSINNLAYSVDNNLPKIITFINQQIADYEKANREADEAISLLVNGASESNQ